MKSILGILCIFSALAVSCAGVSGKKDPPVRRHFESVVIPNENSKSPFVVNEYRKNNMAFSRQSANYATALLLTDLGILQNTPKERFEKFVHVFFDDMPAQGEYKEIVIPNLSTSSEKDIEKNGYLFILPATENKGNISYRIETNIPIGSYTTRDLYSGYEIRIKNPFYRNKVPGSWVAWMTLFVKNDMILYKGVKYPLRSAPLCSTEKAIHPDSTMEVLLAADSIDELFRDLLYSRLEMSSQKEMPLDKNKLDILDKYFCLSGSLYSYLEKDLPTALQYLRLAHAMIADLPKGPINSYLELEKIMDYLLFTIEGLEKPL